MKIEYIGPGEPEIALLGTAHGNEPCGREALTELRAKADKLKGCVLAIHVNEAAAKRDERFIDQDLNRVYPGGLQSEHHEERLAAIVHHLTRDLPVYDLHSTSIPTPSGGPFAIFGTMSEEVIQRVKRTGVDRVLYFESDDGSGLFSLESVEVEHTPKGSKKARRQAVSTIEQILATHGILEQEAADTDPLVYRVYDSVEKTGDWDIVANNWMKVEEGETIATSDSGPVRASESFVPVIFSEDYDNILGYKAREPITLNEFERKT